MMSKIIKRRIEAPRELVSRAAKKFGTGAVIGARMSLRPTQRKALAQIRFRWMIIVGRLGGIPPRERSAQEVREMYGRWLASRQADKKPVFEERIWVGARDLLAPRGPYQGLSRPAFMIRGAGRNSITDRQIILEDLASELGRQLEQRIIECYLETHFSVDLWAKARR